MVKNISMMEFRNAKIDIDTMTIVETEYEYRYVGGKKKQVNGKIVETKIADILKDFANEDGVDISLSIRSVK